MDQVFEISRLNGFLKNLRGVEPLETFTFRILEYAEKTGVRFLKSNATKGWESLGVSNLRGFAPQKRVVLVNSDWVPPKKISTKDADEHWTTFYFLIHDVLHIYFYDNATAQLGPSVWQNEDSFVACHLASEAFAVLTLDYFIFPYTPVQKIGLKRPYGVAAHVKKEWLEDPSLEAHLTKLTWKLLNLYRQGTNLNLGRGPHVRSKAYKELIKHEVNYSQKQRVYSANWWNFLNGKKVVENPAIHFFKVLEWEPELLVRFFCDLLDGTKFKKMKPSTDYFGSILKASKKRAVSQVDFRFQNVFSFSPQEVRRMLKEGFNKNPSFHFLAAQLLCVVGPKDPLNSPFSKDIELLYGKRTGALGVKNDTARRLVEHLILTLEKRFKRASYLERAVFYLS